MLWLFHAGRVAAIRQLLAIIVATLSIALLSHFGLMGPILEGRGELVVASPFLPWLYWLLGMHAALTGRRLMADTAARIRNASHSMNSAAPQSVTRELVVHLWMAVAALTILTLVPAPRQAVVAAMHFGCPAAAAIGWPALMSMGLAYFAANAFAARQAL